MTNARKTIQFSRQKIVPVRNVNFLDFLSSENRSWKEHQFLFHKKSVRTPYLSLPTKYRIVHSVVSVVSVASVVVVVIHRPHRLSVFPNPFKHEDFTSVT